MFYVLRSSSLIRLALLGDAVASGAAGLAMSAGSELLHEPLGLPQALLFRAGVFLLFYGALVGVVGTRTVIARGMVWTIAIFNAVWAVESIAIIPFGWVSPTTLGTVFLSGQAIVVLVLAWLQCIGLRQARYATA